MFRFFILSLSLLFPILGQSERAFQIVGSNKISIVSGESTDIEVTVALPKGQHLYVKPASALSMNMPTSFSTKTPGFLIDIKETPDSKKKDEDFILEGKGPSVAGKYVLTVFETLGRSVSKKSVPLDLEITTQWCQSSTNKCFPPKTFKRKLNVTISGEKNVTAVTKKERGGVSWVQSHADALTKGTSSGKNIFLIITAPTWCGFCKVLERDVFAKKPVIDTLNDKFVPLQILDTNPDKRKFNFNGYPTMMVLSPKGQTLATVNGRDESTFLAAIKRFESEGGTVTPTNVNTGNTEESYKYAIRIEGQFTRLSNGTWTHKDSSGTKSLQEVRRDEHFVILLEKDSSLYYAIPSKGSKTAYIFKNNKWEPLQLD
jgi:thiol-disulfide isomerase/thioredoxin